MSIVEATALIEELSSRQVQLWVDGEQLRYRAPQGTMTPELRARLQAHKSALMASLGAAPAANADAHRPLALTPAHGDEPFALTELQHAYFLGHGAFAELGGLPAQIYLEFELPGLDLDRLERVAQRLIARHDGLRIVVLRDGRQRVCDDAPPFYIPRLDLSGCPAAEVAAARATTRRQLMEGAVDPFSGPPFAARAHRVGDGWTVFVCVSLIVLDGTSLRILLEEGTRLYADEGAALPALGISYRAYVEAVAGVRDTAAYQASLAWWRARVPTLPGAPELPLVGSGSTRADRFTRRVKRLQPERWRDFKRRSQEAGVTPAAALCAAYASTLAAWSRHARFLLNVMYLNRPALHPDAGRVVGNFASTTLLEVDLTGENGGDTLLDRARGLQRRLLGDLEHGAVSGMVVAREINLAEHAQPRPRAPVVFATALDAGERARLGWLDRLAFGALHTPHVWLDHQVIEDGGSVVLNWDAVEELFPAGMLDDAFAAYGDLIDRLASGPEAWHEAPALLPAAHARLVEEANATDAPLAPATLPELVLAQAARDPAAPAVISPERRLSYGELVAEAGAIATWLRAHGARRNALVAVVMEKGWEQVVAVQAITQAGAAYLPIDPALPAERLRFLIGQCEPGLVLTQRRVDAALAWPAGTTRLCVDAPLVDTVSTALALVDSVSTPASLAAVGPAPDDLAYVIFTSGSTGTPKGVMIAHRGAVNTVLDVNQRFAVGPADRVLALSALSFDLSVYDVFGLLAAGGAIVMPPAAAARDPGAWLELVERERVTVWNSVPALAQLAAEHAAAAGKAIGPALRLVLMSGDWIPVRLPEMLRALAPGVEVMSLGGATEGSIWSILAPTEGVPPDAASIPYGKAMVNQRMYVLDDALTPRPLWVPGEIYIGGVGVAEGYFRDPGRTAERFLTHPRTGERLYRTGDVGRLLPDGAIEFLGREDAQVKVQGFRIELGEIERALEHTVGVRAAVVAAVGERRGAKTLVAYLVLDETVEPPRDAAALRAALGELLPAYMVPARFVVVPALPLTGNGKVDRGALARLDADERPAFVAPRPGLESAVAALWREVLGKGEIGAHDDFFALGGHSLLAVRLGALLATRLGREVPIAALLAHPTVATQAAHLGGGDALPPNVVRLAAGAAGKGAPLFLVHPVGGNVVCYRELAARLRAHGPVYGVHAGEHADGPTTLAAMARGYLEAIRAVQPEGPYRLGGWSLGGFVALEMARLLTAAGEAVGLLFAVDSRLPTPGASSAEAPELLGRFLGDLAGAGTGATADLALLVPRLRKSDDAIGVAHGWAQHAGILPRELSRPAFERMYRVFERNARALLVYAPEAYAGTLLAFAATEGLAGHDGADAWAAPRRVIAAVDGDHYSVMRGPGLAAIAGRLEEELSRG